MNLFKILLALALLASATATTLAQSQPNHGASRNGGSDTFGQPYSGSAGARHRSGGW